MSPSTLDLVVRLLVAALLGAAIGLERELRQKAAGLRTNSLIALGAALMTIVSQDLAAGSGGDPSRVAAQIVSGIGFLGGGAIIFTQGTVQGLTTAATIWVNAAIGMTVGTGRIQLALIATAATIGVLTILVPLDRFLEKRQKSAAEQPLIGS